LNLAAFSTCRRERRAIAAQSGWAGELDVVMVVDGKAATTVRIAVK